MKSKNFVEELKEILTPDSLEETLKALNKSKTRTAPAPVNLSETPDPTRGRGSETTGRDPFKLTVFPINNLNDPPVKVRQWVVDSLLNPNKPTDIYTIPGWIGAHSKKITGGWLGWYTFNGNTSYMFMLEDNKHIYGWYQLDPNKFPSDVIDGLKSFNPTKEYQMVTSDFKLKPVTLLGESKEKYFDTGDAEFNNEITGIGIGNIPDGRLALIIVDHVTRLVYANPVGTIKVLQFSPKENSDVFNQIPFGLNKTSGPKWLEEATRGVKRVFINCKPGSVPTNLDGSPAIITDQQPVRQPVYQPVQQPVYQPVQTVETEKKLMVSSDRQTTSSNGYPYGDPYGFPALAATFPGLAPGRISTGYQTYCQTTCQTVPTFGQCFDVIEFYEKNL